jgi:hypothetical protein
VLHFAKFSLYCVRSKIPQQSRIYFKILYDDDDATACDDANLSTILR